MARKSTQIERSEVGDSREAKISAMIAVSMSNEAIYAAFQQGDKTLDQKSSSFNKLARQRLQEAIRSVRHAYQNEEEELASVLEHVDDNGVKSINEIELSNIARFSTGMPVLDHIYGETKYIYTEGPNLGQLTGQVEVGMPEAFLSIWAGSPGVGKTRLAIAATKSLNKLLNRVLYLNGEANESDFRSWAGSDVDPKLFLVRTADSLRMETIVSDIYRYRPRVVFVDSIQMIAEAEKGGRGMKTVLSRFKVLKNDPLAGKPHIVFISQLNKKGELAGSRFIEHMVDFVAGAKKIDGRKGQFLFEVPRKNRGGATPRMATFRHIDGTVESLSQDHSFQQFKLVQENVQAAPELDGPALSDEPVINQFVPAE